MSMTNRIKSTVSALSVALCLLIASQSAFAAPDREDIVRSEQAAIQDALDGTARGYRCETVELEDGTFEAQCDDMSDPEVAACEAFSYMYSVGDRDMAYEACMTIALHTPGAVR